MNVNVATIQTEIANKVKTELQDLVNKGKIRNYNVRVSQYFNRITPLPLPAQQLTFYAIYFK